jgi:probable HAF family extracellular repeat protein
MLAAAAVAAPAVADTSTTPPDASANYVFTTHNDSADPTFNQLLGINNEGVIAGYYGSGMAGHPNRGYTTHLGRGFRNENVPHAAQTQVTGLNNTGITVGFWVGGGGANHGFYERNGRFHTTDDPAGAGAHPVFDQLLGVNDRGEAVGFYNGKGGNPKGFTYDIPKRSFHPVTVRGDTDVTATAINNEGDVAGFATNSAGTTEAFLKRSDGKVIHLTVPGSSMTQGFGVNDGDEVVGAYTVGTGSAATTDGFVWSPGFGFETVNDPNGLGSTTINGVNDRGSIVGFYTDSAGNTDGFVGKAAD